MGRQLVYIVVFIGVAAPLAGVKIVAPFFGGGHNHSDLIIVSKRIGIGIAVAVTTGAGVKIIAFLGACGVNDSFGVAVLVLCWLRFLGIGCGRRGFGGELVGVVIFIAVAAAAASVQIITHAVGGGGNGGHLEIVPKSFHKLIDVAGTAGAGIFSVALFGAGGINDGFGMAVGVVSSVMQKLVGEAVLIAVAAAAAQVQIVALLSGGGCNSGNNVAMTQCFNLIFGIAVAAIAGRDGAAHIGTGGFNNGLGIAVLMVCGERCCG